MAGSTKKQNIIGARSALKDAKRIVVKIGTSSLTHKNGSVNLRRIEKLVRVIVDLMNEGREVILVSSGAIGLGRDVLKLSEKPKTVSMRQMAAAVGQVYLMQVYGRIFTEYGINVGQILLTKFTVDNEESRSNAVNAFNELLRAKVVPIVNENDTVAVDEIKFGDNDNLSSIVARLVKADALILLTDIDGYYKHDPKNRTTIADDDMYHEITDLTEEIERAAGGSGTNLGTGGMLTKVHAARLAAREGIYSVVANGTDPGILFDILEGKEIGTLFVPVQDVK